jgi:lipopolysaccharide transport system permease protein
MFKSRELLFVLLARGFKAKYKNSSLGIFWSLLNPLLNVAIFAFIFSVIIKIDIKQYPFYLLSTMFVWTFFSASLSNSIVSIVEDGHFVKNAAFNFEMIPLAVTLVNFVNLLIDLVILTAVLIISGKGIGPVIFYLPVLLIIALLLTSGLSIMAAGLFVLFRDLNFILQLFLKLFFYFVPVVYSLEFVPEGLRPLYFFNPLAVVIDGFAKVFYYRSAPDAAGLWIAGAESLLIFAVCFSVFRRLRGIIPERL